MSSAAAQPCPPDRPAWAQAAYERQLARLDRLADAGLEISAAIELQARVITAAGPTPGLAIDPAATRAFAVFPRVARAVRLSLMLQDQVIRHLLGEDEPTPRRQDPASPAHEPITRIVRNLVSPGQTEGEGRRLDGRLGENGERSEYREWPDSLEDDLARDLARDGTSGLMDQPVSEVIARICRDLGLGPDAPARIEEALAREAAAGAAANAVFGWPTSGPGPAPRPANDGEFGFDWVRLAPFGPSP